MPNAEDSIDTLELNLNEVIENNVMQRCVLIGLINNHHDKRYRNQYGSIGVTVSKI